MSDPRTLEWMKSATNELNNLLQAITESAQFLEKLHASDSSTHKYCGIIRNSVDRASAVTRQMVDRTSDSNFHAPAPSTPRPAAPATPSGSSIEVANAEGKGELILIVDDEDFVTMLAERVLADEGYRVITARDGIQALDIYKKLKDQIDLVILDFTMPMMDGSEVFTELRMMNPMVAVVLSSGFTEQDKLRWMLSKGLRGFIPKPYTQQKLLLQVRSVLDATKNERR